jgi:hypothetical protein
MKLFLIALFAFCPWQLQAQSGGGGQTRMNESGWTVDTLKSHEDDMAALRQKLLDERNDHTKEMQQASDKRNSEAIQFVKESAALALTSAREANLKSEMQSDKRFESVNEFRKTLSDQTNTFIPRKEFDQAVAGLTDKLESNTKLLVSRIDLISNRVVEANAAQSGSSSVWVMLGVVCGLIFSAVTALVSVGGLIYMLATRKSQRSEAPSSS